MGSVTALYKHSETCRGRIYLCTASPILSHSFAGSPLRVPGPVLGTAGLRSRPHPFCLCPCCRSMLSPSRAFVQAGRPLDDSSPSLPQPNQEG